MTNPAPYPTSAEDVTAENLAKHLTVAAWHRHLALMESADLDRAAMTTLVRQWGVIYLLRELQDYAGAKAADNVARCLWEAWNDGSHLGEMLWEWLTEYGIDPAAVSR